MNTALTRGQGAEVDFLLADEHGSELVRRAAALRPLLERNAELVERRGELTEEVVAAVDEAGLFNMAAPRRWGGLPVRVETMIDVVGELGMACPSTSWVVSILNSCLWEATQTPLHMQRVIFGNGIPKVCQPYGFGKVIKDGDSYVLNGEWAYGSGSHHADWILLRAFSESEVLMMTAVPKSQLMIKNTWRVVGMRGTGSDTVVAKDVRIGPDQICVNSAIHQTDGMSASAEAEPLDYYAHISFLRSKAIAVLLGIAEGLFREMLKSAGKPIVVTIYKRKMDSSVFHSSVGEVRAKIDTARTIMRHTAQIADDAALCRRKLSYAERAEARGGIGMIIDLLSQAVDSMMTLAGSSAFFESNPAQRFWRDFSIASRHVAFGADVSYEIVGRQVLGVEPNISSAEYI